MTTGRVTARRRHPLTGPLALAGAAAAAGVAALLTAYGPTVTVLATVAGAAWAGANLWADRITATHHDDTPTRSTRPPGPLDD